MKNNLIYNCEYCDHSWNRKYDYEQHIKTDTYVTEIINLLSEFNYIIYIINEKTGARSDCRNFLSIPVEIHNDFLLKCDYLNVLININELESEINKCE